MERKSALASASAARSIASVFGALAGLGGITHGVGEVLQGNVAADGIWINSWAEGPIADNMGGEPGITIVPNLLVTGILAITISLILMIWAGAFVQRKNGGQTMILLSVIMLLVGGGVGPPVMGILAGVAGLGINAPPGWWHKHLSASLRCVLAKLHPWIFWLAVVNGVFLVIGSLILVYFFDLNNPDLFVGSFFFSIVSLLLMNLAGRAYDVHRGQGMINA